MNRDTDIAIARALGYEIVEAVSDLPDDLDPIRIRKPGETTQWTRCQPLPRYQTDIAAAWELVGATSDKYHWVIKTPFELNEPFFAGLTPLGITGWNGRPDISGDGDTAPEAISAAFLKASEQ